RHTASLLNIELLPKWMWLLGALPALVLAAATGYLAVRGSAGSAAGTPSFKSEFGLLLLAWSILLVWYAHTALIVWGARRDTGARTLLRANMGSSWLILLGAIVPIAWISLDPAPGSLLQPLVFALPVLGGVLAMAYATRETRGLPPGC